MDEYMKIFIPKEEYQFETDSLKKASSGLKSTLSIIENTEKKLLRFQSLAAQAILTIRKNKDLGNITATNEDQFEIVVKDFERQYKELL